MTTGARLPFKIAFVSSEDPGFPASELVTSNNSGPGSSSANNRGGWHSARFCEYPQEIVLDFHNRISLSQIQFLSHQSKIASKIELYCGIEGSTLETIRFKRLGYLSLDNNERSNFMARELKSVFLDIKEARFLKIVLQPCHMNKLNTASQVALVGIFCHGIPSSLPLSAPPTRSAAPAINDTGISAQIRELLDKKAAAVAADNFDEAKRLKLEIDKLNGASRTLADLEDRKRAAVAAEDFDTAKSLKIEIDRLKRIAIPAPRQLTVPSEPLPSPKRRQTVPAPDIVNVDDLPAVAKGDALREYAALQAGVGLSEPEPSDLDDGKPHPLDGCGISGYRSLLKPPPVPSTALANSENETIAEFFGEYVLACLLCKDWKLREAGIYKIINDLKTSEINDMQRLVERGIIPWLKRDTEEKNLAVFVASQNLLVLVAEKFMVSSRGFKKSDLQPAIDGLLDKLVDRVGDANRRSHEAAVASFMAFAKNSIVTPQFVCMHAVKGLRGKVQKLPPKTAAARGQLIADLLEMCTDANEAVSVVAGDLLKSSTPESRNVGMEILKILKRKMPVSSQREYGESAFKDVRNNQREQVENDFLPGQQRMRNSIQPPILSARISVDGRCQFCGLSDASFALDGQALDLHYLKNCSALAECRQCGQIVEKAGLYEHLENECSAIAGQVQNY